MVQNVDVTNLNKVADVRSFTGSEGRVNENYVVDFSGLGYAAMGLRQAAVTMETANKVELATAKATTTSEAYTTQAQIRQAILTGDTGTAVRLAAGGYEQDMGQPMDAEDKEALKGYYQRVKKLTDMFKSLPEHSKQRKLSLALRQWRTSFVAAHPLLGVEALTDAGKVDDLDNAAFFEQGENIRERKKVAVDSMATFITNQGDDFMTTERTPEEVVAHFNNTYGAQQRRTADVMRESAEFKATNGANAEVTKYTDHKLLLKQQSAVNSNVFTELNAMLQNFKSSQKTPEDINTLVGGINALKAETTQRLVGLGIANSVQDVNNNFGAVFSVLDLVKKNVMAGDQVTALSNVVKAYSAGAALDMGEVSNGAVYKLSAVGEFMKHASPNMQGPIMREYVGMKAIREASAAMRPSAPQSNPDPFGWLDNDQLSFPNQSGGTAAATPTDIQKAGRAVLGLTQGAVNGYKNYTDPATKTSALQLVRGTILSPYASDNASVWSGVLDIMGSDGFKAMVNDSDIIGKTKQRVVATTSEFIATIDNELSAATDGSGVAPIEWDDKNNQIVLTKDAYESMAEGVRGRFTIGLRHINEAIRVMHDVYGVGKTYQEAGAILYGNTR